MKKLSYEYCDINSKRYVKMTKEFCIPAYRGKLVFVCM